jgi:hypothetical protein
VIPLCSANFASPKLSSEPGIHPIGTFKTTQANVGTLCFFPPSISFKQLLQVIDWVSRSRLWSECWYLPKFLCWNFTPNEIVLTAAVWEVSHERALVISTTLKKWKGALLLPCEDTARGITYEAKSRQFPDRESVDTLILKFPPCRTGRNKFLLFIKYLVQDILNSSLNGTKTWFYFSPSFRFTDSTT